LSSEQPRQKLVRFVDVSTGKPRAPAWLEQTSPGANDAADDTRVETLRPPRVPHDAAHPLAPILESVLPPPPPAMRAPRAVDPETLGMGALRPSQLPGRPSQLPRRPSQLPARPSQLPPDLPLERKTDTLIEDLVPRAEEEAAAAIVEAIEQFSAARAALLEGAEQELIQLVRSVARRVIERELLTDPTLVDGLVRSGLEALGHADRVSVRLGPFFADAAPELREKLEQRGIDCVVSVDATLGPYGCLLETELGKVDESIEARLDVLLSHLGAGE
jgi:flagellar assembly protein FliH